MSKWFVKIGDSVTNDKVFNSKAEASIWIDAFGYELDWRAGYVFRLKGDHVDRSIVNKHGIVAKV